MLSAGTAVEWLRDDLGIIEDAADSHRVAAACDDTGDVLFVPALLGLGTPVWDFGAAAPSSASPAAPVGPRWCAPCSRASPTGARTCWRRPRPTPP